MTAASLRGWAKIKDAASYADVSPRTFRKWLGDGLRYVKAPSGAILVKFEWIDEFLTKYEVSGINQIDDIVNSALKGIIG